jgi:DNA-binding protein Fis
VNADDLRITSDGDARDIPRDLPEPFPGFSMREYLARLRTELFFRALTGCNGNQTEAGALLGISKEAVSKFCQGIQATLAACNGNQAEAAARLGIAKEAVSEFCRCMQTTAVDGE